MLLRRGGGGKLSFSCLLLLLLAGTMRPILSLPMTTTTMFRVDRVYDNDKMSKVADNDDDRFMAGPVALEGTVLGSTPSDLLARLDLQPLVSWFA